MNMLEIRERLKLSQNQFAPLVGVTRVTVNRWERGHIPNSPLRDVLEGLLAGALYANNRSVVIAELQKRGDDSLLGAIRVLTRLERR